MTGLVRVVILSVDSGFKALLSSALKREAEFDVLTNCFSLQSISEFIIPNKPNTLIIDQQGMVLNEGYLRNLTQKYNLAFFLVGKVQGFDAAKAGAGAILQKPDHSDFSKNTFVRIITEKIKSFASKNVPVSFSDMRETVDSNTRIIAIAASTGGTEALVEVLKVLPVNCPPILIVQHMPSMFTRQYAERVDKLCKFKVKEGEDGEYIKRGTAYIAPGGFHMGVIKKNSRLAINCFLGEKLHGVRPSADIMFNSLIPVLGGNVIGVILTGMGMDGARGLYELHMKGAKVIGQDEKSSVVYGMPKAAFDIGAVDFQLPLDKIGNKIMSLV